MREAEVDWATLLAAGDQPSQACWAKLIAELRGAAAELAGGGRHTRLAPELAATLRTLIALNDYLRASPALQAQPQLAGSLLRLIAALYEVSQGRLPALFKPGAAGETPPHPRP